MKPLQLKNKKRLRRKQSIRARIRRDTTLPRLSVNRTLKHFSAQIIDDASGNTLCSVTSTGKAAADQLAGKTKTECAKASRRRARREGQGEGHREGRLRPRCFDLPRPRQGLRRRRA